MTNDSVRTAVRMWRRVPGPLLASAVTVAGTILGGCSNDRASTLNSLAGQPVAARPTDIPVSSLASSLTSPPPGTGPTSGSVPDASAAPGVSSASAVPDAGTTGSAVPGSGAADGTGPVSDSSSPAVTPVYVFPFTGKQVSYHRTHHDYPAADVFGCGAGVVAPTAGRIDEVSVDDRWDPKINDPATRGGKFVSLIGVDGVRYYFAHLDSVAVAVGDEVTEGTPLGVMGQTGNARNSACHTHFGISWVCPGHEWQVRRGEIWPWRYLDAWRDGEQKSPSLEILVAERDLAQACAEALAAMPGTSAPSGSDSTVE